MPTTFPALVGQTLDGLVGASRGSRTVLVVTVGDENKNWRCTANVLAPEGATVLVDSVTGNPSHLLGTPLTEVTETVESAGNGVITTHTFRTTKGSVDVRWVGSVQAQLFPNLK